MGICYSRVYAYMWLYAYYELYSLEVKLLYLMDSINNSLFAFIHLNCFS
jgi:hypothetical protein